ncbi:hypothetical protein CRUP_037928, partial [Coryphaenoides rupestris]
RRRRRLRSDVARGCGRVRRGTEGGGDRQTGSSIGSGSAEPRSRGGVSRRARVFPAHSPLSDGRVKHSEEERATAKLVLESHAVEPEPYSRKLIDVGVPHKELSLPRRGSL